MTALILAVEKAIEGQSLNDRIPDNTAPGIIFTSIVCGSCIAWCVWVWYKNFGPGAPPETTET